MSFFRLLAFAVSLVLLGCTAAPAAQPATDGAPSQRQAPKRVALALKQEPALLASDIGPYGGGTVQGTATVLDLVHAGMATRDPQGKLVERLASTVPTVENGLWKVGADGTMETTWKIKPTARWHDGAPYTAEDLLFTLQAKRDKDLPFVDIAFDYIDHASAPDAQTVTIKWSRTYLEADGLFSSRGGETFGGVIPKHLLEQPYREDRANFMNLAYWNEGFVGTGPFKMREWARGSHYLLVANDDYILGRPKLDEVEVKFLLDPTVIVANLLAGTADVSIGGLQVPLDMALDVKDRWTDGRMLTQISRTNVIFPQFINSNPAIIGTSVQFRRALIHALDRQTMGEAFQTGLPTEVAHSFLTPSELGFAEIIAAVPHYEYDLRHAETMLAKLGYQKGASGNFRSASGEELRMEIRSTTNVDPRVMLALADGWQRFGIPMETVVIPPQRASDREYRATFPGFVFTANGMTNLAQLTRSHSRETPLPENTFNGGNTSRYRNAEFDSLVDRILTTIPAQERTALAAQAHRIVIDQVVTMPLWYPVEPGALLRNSIQNLELNPNGIVWQAHLWDLAR